MKKIIKLLILLIGVLPIVGCGNTSSLDKDSQHKINEIKAGADISININDITDMATYYNYFVDGVNIQAFAVRGSDDIIRILLNTCGVCNPSPDAYFIQEGDYFVCQTCSNKFHRDEIGLEEAKGCSPIAILDENKHVDNDNITISSEFIETHKSMFKNIKANKIGDSK